MVLEGFAFVLGAAAGAFFSAKKAADKQHKRIMEKGCIETSILGSNPFLKLKKDN